MTDDITAWQEIKSSLGVLLKIIGYSAIALSLFFGAGYVYFTCFQ